ncbi:alkaline phosphatase family protein [Fulvivirga sp.]|uniref:alkaline phosphatase family protein n=1 Tax=Fulvivirga sp. TaxID=1931237 RepID=UPI0032EADDEB
MKKYLILVIVLFFQSEAYCQNIKQEDVRTLIVFFDGLRPDYITKEGMPNLYAFSKRGVVAKNHHSVFPTVTRVNSPSYATGSYPKSHGIMGNSVFFEGIDPKQSLNTGDFEDLERINEFTDGKLLTAKSLGELIHENGHHMMVFSSGSAGQAFLQNHTISGGAVVNSNIILPESMQESILKEFGPIPEHSKPNTAQHQWMTNALIKKGLKMDGPLVSAIWYSDPDGTAHADGIGSPSAIASIKSVDTEFGKIISALKQKGLSDNYNIIVSTDHGFITNVGKDNLTQVLIDNGLKADKNSDDVVVAGGAIHLKDKSEANIEQVVKVLQSEEWIGAIFTKASKQDKTKGIIDGTLSFNTIHWNHPDRTADILVSPNWNDDKNEKGYAGTSFSRGVAGHGGISPYEINITLLAAGPSFKKSFSSDLPTSNVDIVPTVLAIHNLPLPETVNGRVLNELLKKGQNVAAKPKIETISTSVELESGIYELILQRTIYGAYYYVDFARTVRSNWSN